MLNNLVARFIGPFLSQYCKEINSNQIEIEIRNGKAQLKDLVFQEDCFIHHHIPFYVKRGLINSFSLSLSSDQCNIFIENLILVGSEVFGSTLITENQFIDTFSEKTFLKQILKSILSIFFDPSFDNLKKLFDNLTISIQKVHIRIEGLMNNKSLGVMFGSLNFYSVNDEFQKITVTNHPSTFSKKIDVKNFSIYFDTENKYPINKYTDSFESQMIMQIVNENEFILNPISFDCIFKYNTEFNSIFDFKLNLGELKLTFNNNQYEAFQNLIYNIKIQRFYNFLIRPFKSVKSERSSTLWWCYSYRCIRYKKTAFQQLNVPLALDVLKKRKKFYGLWKDYVLNSERYGKDYNEFKNTLNPNTLALLRYYSSFNFSKNSNNHSKLFTEDEIVRYFAKAKDMIPSEFDFSIDSLQLDLNLNIKVEKQKNDAINDNQSDEKQKIDLNNENPSPFPIEGNQNEEKKNSDQINNQINSNDEKQKSDQINNANSSDEKQNINPTKGNENELKPNLVQDNESDEKQKIDSNKDIEKQEKSNLIKKDESNDNDNNSVTSEYEKDESNENDNNSLTSDDKNGISSDKLKSFSLNSISEDKSESIEKDSDIADNSLISEDEKFEYINTPLSGLSIEKILIKISKTKDDINLTIDTNSIYINNYLNEKYRDILQIADGVKIFLNFNRNEPNQTIKFNVQSISAVFDANFFSLFFKYFYNVNLIHCTNRISIKEKCVKYLIESHIKTKLDLQVGNLNLIIPYQEIEVDTPVIQISSDLIEFHSASQSRYNINLVESLYDKYELSLNSVQFLLNNKSLANKINIKSNINTSILPCLELDPIIVNNYISPLEINLTAYESIILAEIFMYLSDEFSSNDDNDKIINIPIPEFKISFSIPSTTIIFSFRENAEKLENTESYQILLKEQTELNLFRKNQILNFCLLNNSGIEGFEYFNSKGSKFLFSEKFELDLQFQSNYSNKVKLDFGDIEVYAKSIPIHFIQVFAESPKHYEWKLNLRKEPTILKFLHKRNEIKKKSNGFDMNIKFGQTIIYFIEYELNSKEEKEMFTLIINQILVFISHNPEKTTAKIISDPPLATTSQFGKLWANMISNGETSKNPIVVNITPTHLAIDLDYFQVSISPILLSKIIKFSLIEKNPYSHLPGDTGTAKYLTFDLHVEKVLVKIIYDFDSYNYFELTINHSSYVTLKAPFIHQIALDSLQIVQKIRNKKDILLFKLQNVTAQLEMKLLLRENVDDPNAESFKSLVEKKGIQKWTEETVNFIESNQTEKILSHLFFYFYKLCFNCKLDYLFCLYSHEFARNASYLLSKLLDIMKADKFIEFLKGMNEPLDFSINLAMPKGEFLIVDQKEVNIAKLFLDSAVVQVNPDPFLFNASLNSINLIDYQKDKILEVKDLIVKTIEDEIYIILESINVNLKLSYLPDSIYYIMNCPLFSFVDEFNNNKELTPTSFEMLTKKFFFSLNSFQLTFPIVKNIFLFETAIDVTLTSKRNIVQINNIQMFMNQRIMMKQFSISFANDVWNVEPISIYFSVFELHIIKLLIEEIKQLTMPQIFISKKEAELKRREFTIKLQQIDFIFTQPNLPFLILEIKPSTFKQSYSDAKGGQQIIDYNVEMLLKHENHSNYGIDTIIDPFVISVNSKKMNQQKNTYAHISPINIAVSPYILSEIIQIKKRYSSHKATSQIFQDKSIFFRNDTGIPIDLYLTKISTKEEVKFEINDNSPFQINNSCWTMDIKVVFLYKTVFFSIKDLCYPIFFDRNVLAYLVADFGIQTIHFSSPYMIKNELSYDIEVFVNDYNIGVVKSKNERPIPLVLVTSLANGIKAVISPIKTDPSPAIKFKKPNSEAKLYKFVDAQYKRNLYSSVCFSTDSQRSICFITFLPYAIYMNQLPIPVSLTLLNDYNLNYRIGTNQFTDVSFLKDKKSKLKIKVAIESFGESEPTYVHTFKNQSNPSRVSIKKNNEEKCKIAVMSEYSKITNTFRIIIFAPCILYNNTGASLMLKESKDSFYPFVDNICFYTPDEYPKKAPLRILIKDVTKINNIDINCLNTKSVETFPLPFINNEKVFLILSATKILISFENITQLSLMVYFMVYNHLNKSVFMIPSNIENSKQFSNHCKPNTKVPIVFTNLEGKFKLMIDGYEKCKEVDLTNQTTTIFRLLSKDENVPDFLIQLDVIKEENGFCGHLSYPTFPSPTVITNMLFKQSISVFQKTSTDRKHPMIVNSMTTSIFAKPQPFIEQESNDENSVVVCINSLEFSVSFTSDISPQQIEKTNYYYEVRTTNSGDKMIIVGEYQDEQNLNLILNQHLSKTEKALINIHFTKLEISFIDNYMHELFLLVIKNLIFKHKKQKSIKITIDSLHVNDMYIASKSPVVICEKEPKFLILKLKSKLPIGMHSYDNLYIKIAPIHIFIDIKFVLDICFTISEYLEHFKIEIEKKKEVDENKLKRFSFYSLKHLFISPLHIEFTLVKSKGRLNRVPYPKKRNFILLCLIQNIFVIPFETYKEFKAIEIQNIRAPIHNFIKSLCVMYLNQISTADIYNLIFRDSSLFNLSSTESFIDFIEDSFNESHQSKIVKAIAKPERIPRAFPLNRIISVSSTFNNDSKANNYCRYSLAQFTFQKTHPYESLLVLVDSKSDDIKNDKVLAIFNHYIVILSANLQEVKLSIKIPDFLMIDNQGNLLIIVIKNNQQIEFKCKDEHESRLIVTIIRSIAYKMSLFCEFNC